MAKVMPDTFQVLLKVDEVWIKKRRLSFMNWNPGSFAGKDLLFLTEPFIFFNESVNNQKWTVFIAVFEFKAIEKIWSWHLVAVLP